MYRKISFLIFKQTQANQMSFIVFDFFIFFTKKKNQKDEVSPAVLLVFFSLIKQSR